jgi:hypothetical protein
MEKDADYSIAVTGKTQSVTGDPEKPMLWMLHDLLYVMRCTWIR